MDKILAVIVLYKQDLESSLTFTSLVESLEAFKERLDIIVYDNSPAATVLTRSTPNCRLTYVHNPTNPGLSKAYNESADFGRKNGKNWLLLLDQDSSLPKNFFDILLKNIDEYKTDAVIAPILQQNSVILSPCNFKFMKGSVLKKVNAGPLSLKNISLLNSGMCVNLNAFEEVKGYNESVKLDFSDHAFINRIKKKYHRIVVTQAIIEHQLSSNSDKQNVVYSRFKQYCAGIKAYIHSEEKNYLLLFWTGLRALKLFVIYRDIKFLRTFLSCF